MKKLPKKSLGGVMRTGASVASLIPGGQLIGGALGVAGSISDMVDAQNEKEKQEKEIARQTSIESINTPVTGKNLSKALPMYFSGGDVPTDIEHNGKKLTAKTTMVQDGKVIPYSYNIDSLKTNKNETINTPVTYPTAEDIESTLIAKQLGYPKPKINHNRTMPLNPNEMKAARMAGLLAYGGYVKGGKLKPISKHLVHAEGETHDGPNEGIDLKSNITKGKTIAKVEDSETILKEGGKPDFVFSDRIEIGNKSFADMSKEVANDKTALKTLANTQEKVKGKLPVYALGGPSKDDLFGGRDYKSTYNLFNSSLEQNNSTEQNTEDLFKRKVNPSFSLGKKPSGLSLDSVTTPEITTGAKGKMLGREVRLLGKDKLDNYIKEEYGKANKFSGMDAAQIAAPVLATGLFRGLMPKAPVAVTNKGYGAARAIMPTKFSLDSNRQDIKQSEANVNQVLSQNTSNSGTLRSNILANRVNTIKGLNEINQAEQQGQNQLDAARASLEIQAGADEQNVVNANNQSKFNRNALMASETVKGLGAGFEAFANIKKEKEQTKKDLLGLSVLSKSITGKTGIDERLMNEAQKTLTGNKNPESKAYGGKLKSKKLKSC